MYSITKHDQKFTYSKNINAKRGSGAIISVTPATKEVTEIPQLMFKTRNLVLSSDMQNTLSVAITNTNLHEEYTGSNLELLPKGTYCLKLDDLGDDGDNETILFHGSEDDIREIAMRILEAIESDPNAARYETGLAKGTIAA